jgi:hypothetical protein
VQRDELAEPVFPTDIAVFTSGQPDRAARRLMQGFGLHA